MTMRWGILLAMTALTNCASPAPTADKPRAMEVVARLPHAVGNITFTPEGALIHSNHPFFEPDIRVAMLDASGTRSTPFPNKAWNTPGSNPNAYLDSVLGVRGTAEGVVWMLDMGNRAKITPKLVGWDTRTDKLERVYPIPAPASQPFSQHNDFVVDPVNGAFYLADEAIGEGGDGSKGALVVVDMATGAARRVLEGHVSTRAEPIPITIAGKPLETKGEDGAIKPLLIGADGVIADKRFEWLYYGPLNGRSLYRVRIKDLLDPTLSNEALGERVERYSDKPNNGGLAIDDAGNIYLTEVEGNAVGIISADTRSYSHFASHPELSWPDGVSYSPNGYMYVPAAQVHLGAAFNDGQARNRAPYLIMRFKPLAPSVIGH